MAVTTSSGNGFALYNGVKVSDIDSLWTDKVAYPYAWILYVYEPSLDVWEVSVYFSPVPFYIKNDPDGYMAMYPDSACTAISYSMVGGSWSESFGIPFDEWEVWSSALQHEFSVNTFMNNDPIWSNFNINDQRSNSVYLAASDPIPLDGMNVIEWDGDTTGLRNLADVGIVNQYIASADSIDLSSADGCIYVAQVADIGARVGFFGDDLEFHREGTGEEWMWTLSLASTVVAGSYNVPSLSIVGTSFYSDAAQHTALFAYPASGGGEPTYDRTAFLSGMAIGLCGKGDPTFEASDTFAKGYKVGAALRRKRVIV